MSNIFQKIVSYLLVTVLVVGVLVAKPQRSNAVTCGFGTDIGGGVCRGFLVSPTGSNQTFTSPSDWNNSNNTIEVIGAGGSGGASQLSSQGRATGGGGGAWSKITNFSFASPGVTTATYQIGTGGTAVSAAAVGGTGDTGGNAGGDTWFNSTTFAGSSVGAKGGGGGNASTGSTNLAGGVGGASGSGTGTSNKSGGNGGATATFTPEGTGGGGAAGSTGAGAQGVDATANSQATNGGAADAGGTGAGTAGTGSVVAANATTGGSGTEWDGSHGSGGGAGGKRVASNSSTSASMAGGNYGGGGGGCRNNGSGNNSSVRCTSGAGADGIIVITYTPSSAVYSISITSSGVVSYGYVALSTASSTVGNGYTQTAQNDGNTTEKLNVKSSDATNGTGWTLASSIGSNQFKHEFSTTTGSRWDVMPDSATYVVANPSIAVSGTTNFDFRLTTPSASTDYVQKAITITIQAVAP